ncbi:MAG: hypothetical protein F4X20_04210 [Dehalococcoidia bacterium]|nr:hypothetical protein [Dehalococcoidia bacterium]
MEDDFLMLEDPREQSTGEKLSLMVLLERIVREQGQMGAAELLGVNYKTVAAALETRHLSRRMTHALELLLLSEENPIFQKYQDRFAVIDERLDGLENIAKELVAGVEGLRTSLDTHRAAQERLNRSLERRIGGSLRVEAESREARETKPASRGKGVTPMAIEAPARPTRPTFPRRDYDEIVTVEPSPDDSYVYGKAWPMVREWRMLRGNHPVRGDTLSWMERQERLLMVELALLNDHGLTLPPDAQPIDDHWRRHVTGWRLRDLRVVRRRILRRKLLRWVRRLATFGAWWG